MASPTRAEGLIHLRTSMEQYAPLTDDTWTAIAGISSLREIRKGEFFSRAGDTPDSFGYVCHGLLRNYTTTESGQQYNKVFFDEGTFPGSMVALLTSSPSTFAIEALEDSWIMSIHFARFRKLLKHRPDLMWFQIRYLEANWLLAKEQREVALVQESATERYLHFLREHPTLESRVAQYHLASHLGITPTQLSRIRRTLRDSD